MRNQPKSAIPEHLSFPPGDDQVPPPERHPHRPLLQHLGRRVRLRPAALLQGGERHRRRKQLRLLGRQGVRPPHLVVQGQDNSAVQFLLLEKLILAKVFLYMPSLLLSIRLQIWKVYVTRIGRPPSIRGPS